jgi:hypothetical protein
MLVSCLAVALPSPVSGSGTYPSRAPKPPNTTIDVDAYHRGKQIFTGVMTLNDVPGVSVLDQAARLTTLQEKLPTQVQRTVTLPALAGTLRPENLEALEYYLAIRYKIELEK